MTSRKGERVKIESKNIGAEEILKLKEEFPHFIKEDKIDWIGFKNFFGDYVNDSPERYSFTWAGKKQALRILQIPSRGSLIPIKEESVSFENTNNLFIEGDNLEVLKLLYDSYYKSIKMIYIDPPYNTGKDRVYEDNYADPLDAYLMSIGHKDNEGNILTTNTDTSGRFHSQWLSMMYPRLFIAHQLLKEEGVICVSIDDHEVYNLRLIMNEIFGEENFVAQLVWEKGRKNDAKLFSVGHEYMLVYARSLTKLKELKTIWREPKPGGQEIWNEYLKLRRINREDVEAIEKALQNWYKLLPTNHPSKKLSRYKHIDKDGPWRDRDISWPGGGGPTYDVIHPITKKPCKVPERGWGFATHKKMEEQIKLGLVVFREDHSEPPFRKAHLKPIFEELDEEDQENKEFVDQESTEREDESVVGMQVMGSYIYKQSQVEVRYLRELMDGKIFDNPKDHEVLARLINYITQSDTEDVILDFFAGSASTAEAVLQLNHKNSNSNRRFIMVQLPELTPDKSTARKNGYLTISDIAKERIRRVITLLKKETRLDYEDLGFKVFKLSESNFSVWQGVKQPEITEYLNQLEEKIDSLVVGWEETNVIYEVAVKEGFKLTCQIEWVSNVTTNKIYRVKDDGKDFLICLDNKIKDETLNILNLTKDTLFVVRDVSLTDTLAANLALQCQLKTI